MCVVGRAWNLISAKVEKTFKTHIIPETRFTAVSSLLMSCIVHTLGNTFTPPRTATEVTRNASRSHRKTKLGKFSKNKQKVNCALKLPRLVQMHHWRSCKLFFVAKPFAIAEKKKTTTPKPYCFLPAYN